MQANLNLNNTTSNVFTNPFNNSKVSSHFAQNNQKGLFKNTNTSQSSFPFGNSSITNIQQSNLQSFGFGIKPSQSSIFKNSTTLPATNIMNTGFRSIQDSKIYHGNIIWQEVKLTGAVKPINTKITDSLVKCVSSQANLHQYNFNQIRCKVYLQKMRVNHNSYQSNGGHNINCNFVQNQPFSQPQNNPCFSISTKNENQKINELNRLMLGCLNHFMSSQTFFPLFSSFLESFGITSDILQLLIRMQLSSQEIKQFINRRLLLKNLQRQKVLRCGLLMHHPKLSHPTAQQSSANYNQNFGNNRFIDYMMFKQNCSWKSQLIEECQKKYLKANIVQNQQKQQAIKQLLDELENIGLAKAIEQQKQQRKNRINKFYQGGHPTLREQQKYIRLDIINGPFSINKTIPLRHKKYYIETNK